MWQDFVISAGFLYFAFGTGQLALDKRTVMTRKVTVPIAGICGVLAITFATAGLSFSALAEAAICIAWTSLAIWRHPRGNTCI